MAYSGDKRIASILLSRRKLSSTKDIFMMVKAEQSKMVNVNLTLLFVIILLALGISLLTYAHSDDFENPSTAGDGFAFQIISNTIHDIGTDILLEEPKDSSDNDGHQPG
ncbi:MAG: hypothetical protein ACOCUR_01465 [Nanoarchaeota archaeon]